jgi:hypothetical protein
VHNFQTWQKINESSWSEINNRWTPEIKNDALKSSLFPPVYFRWMSIEISSKTFMGPVWNENKRYSLPFLSSMLSSAVKCRNSTINQVKTVSKIIVSAEGLQKFELSKICLTFINRRKITWKLCRNTQVHEQHCFSLHFLFSSSYCYHHCRWDLCPPLFSSN